MFDALYCRRHAGVVDALGADHANVLMPDVDNRALSLANWVSRDLDSSIRLLLDTGFPGQTMNVTSVVGGGSWRDRTWGRSWKIVSPLGVDCSVSVTVPEAEDSLVRVAFDGKELSELTPPWIAARRRGQSLDAETDHEERRRFYVHILEDLENALMATKQRREAW